MSRTHCIPLIRVFRAYRGEGFDHARQRRAELVTLDPRDLRIIVGRCQTPFTRAEVVLIHELSASIPGGASADIVLAPDGRAVLEMREAPRATVAGRIPERAPEPVAAAV